MGALHLASPRPDGFGRHLVSRLAMGTGYDHWPAKEKQEILSPPELSFLKLADRRWRRDLVTAQLRPLAAMMRGTLIRTEIAW